MGLVIETEIGHDLDDFLALAWLVDKVEIDAVIITPGGPDQIALTSLIRRYCKKDFDIGVADYTNKHSVGGVHLAVLAKYGYTDAIIAKQKPEAYGDELISKYIKSDYIMLGPAKCLTNWWRLKGHKEVWKPNRITVQGGFCSYNRYRPSFSLAKFEGLDAVPSFNVGGSRDVTINLLSKMPQAHFVGKNVCHAVGYTREDFEQFPEPTTVGESIIRDTLALHFRNKPAKVMHDLVASVLHVQPDIGRWVLGKPACENGKWSTVDGSCKVLVDLDFNKFWKKLGWITTRC